MKLKNDVMIHLTINKELKEELMNQAKKKGLPLTAYIRLILFKVVDEENEK